MAYLDNTGLARLVALIKGSLPTKATNAAVGLVKPDNTTITVDGNGVITAVIPAAPTTDGNYVLKCAVSSGEPTYTWVLET